MQTLQNEFGDIVIYESKTEENDFKVGALEIEYTKTVTVSVVMVTAPPRFRVESSADSG